MPVGLSLHIGLNSVDQTHYVNWYNPLNGAEYDATDMDLIAASQGFQTQTLLGANATRGSVINAINEASTTLNEGDIFLLTFSGHGGQVPDKHTEEDDAEDETWCLFDGELVDDELYEMWYRFREGVRILVFSDSCHSGTVAKFRNELRKDEADNKAKFLPPQVAASTYYRNKDFYDKIMRNIEVVKSSQILASIKLFSACQDNQEATDGTFNGRFTAIMKSVWNGGNFSGNYEAFHKKIQNRFAAFPEQSPNMMNIGKQSFSFDNQKPFTI